jgi:hypothetical protein
LTRFDIRRIAKEQTTPENLRDGRSGRHSNFWYLTCELFFSIHIIMTHSTLHYFALLLVVSLILLQSCGGPPTLQTPAPPQIPTVAGTMTEPNEDFDWTSLAILAEPMEESVPIKPEPATVRLNLPPESILSSPETDAVVGGLKYDTVVSQRPPQTPGSAGWQYRKNQRGKIVGFEISNRGGNRILRQRHDITKNQLFTRDFQFRFDDRARQDIHLSVTDWTPSRDKQFRLSGLMNSVLVFFPRKFVPAITAEGTGAIVTLPTGEKIEFDAETYEIVSGVLAEAPVDLSAPRFPAVEYTGKGVTVRANSRGNDPRVATTATITTGSPDPDCTKGQRCNQCRVPARELWEQHGAVHFKFATDEKFDRYLRLHCGFGLPQDSNETVNQPSKK